MNVRELAELRLLEDGHPWFRARRRALGPVVTEALAGAPDGPWLDLGAGTGANVATWSGARACIALDRAPEALSYLRARPACAGAELLQGSAERLPFADGSVACVTALDLLEHVDDGAALAEIARVLMPAGRLIVSVPAWPSLWSQHDVALAHQRRYRPRSLAALLRAHGFTTRAARGFLCSALPFVWLVRRLRRTCKADARTDFGRLGRVGTAALALLLRFDEGLARLARPSFGLSLIVSAERAQDVRRADRIARTSSSGRSPGRSARLRIERPAAIVAR